MICVAKPHKSYRYKSLRDFRYVPFGTRYVQALDMPLTGRERRVYIISKPSKARLYRICRQANISSWRKSTYRLLNHNLFRYIIKCAFALVIWHFSQLLLYAEQAVVLGTAVTAARCTGLYLPAIHRNGKVGNKGVLTFSRTVRNYRNVACLFGNTYNL